MDTDADPLVTVSAAILSGGVYLGHEVIKMVADAARQRQMSRFIVQKQKQKQFERLTW